MSTRRGRPQIYCSASHRRRAYELCRAQAQLQASVPQLLLGRDVHAMQTKAGIERAVLYVLRKLGFLEGASKGRPPLRIVEKETKD